MNKYIRAFGILSILCFSFYYTEKIALFMQQKDPIYETIETVKKDYETSSVNGIIYDEYIIPGIIGKEVNVMESFQNMKYIGAFEENELVFNEIYPTISLADNKDKIIEKGNSKKQAISFITADEQLITYLEEMGIPYAVLTTKDTVETKREYGLKINNDYSNYQAVEKALKKGEENTDLCYVGNNQKDFCISKGKTLVKETYTLSKSNFTSKYKEISSGSIVYLQDNLGLEYLKILITQIQYQGLEIIPLTDLISERENN